MMTLKGVFPDTKQTKSKNFIRENVKNIHRISLQSSKEDKEKSNENKNKNMDIGKEKGDKRNVSANVLFSKRNTTSQKILSQDNCVRQTKRDGKGKGVISRNNLDLVKTSSDPNIRHGKRNSSFSLSRHKVTYISRGIQTSFDIDFPEKKNESCLEKNVLQVKGIDKVEEEDVRKLNISDHENTEDKINLDETLLQKAENNPVKTECDIPHSSNTLNNAIEDINEHGQTKANRSTLPSKNKSVGSKHRLGVVPKYLLERKEALLKEKQEREAELAQPPCPDGHILLPDQERKDTLHMLKKSYQDCINELNRLPIRSDTLRAHQKKMELEKKLNKLEEGIKVFSRPKVFVKVNS